MSASLIVIVVLLVGIGVLLLLSPGPLLENTGKVQGIVSALLVLAGAFIAFSANLAKICSDEQARIDAQRAKVDAAIDEVIARESNILIMLRSLKDDCEKEGDDEVRDFLGQAAIMLEFFVDRAGSRVSALWDGFDLASKEARGMGIDILVQHEFFVDYLKEMVARLRTASEWTHIENGAMRGLAKDDIFGRWLATMEACHKLTLVRRNPDQEMDELVAAAEAL